MTPELAEHISRLAAPIYAALLAPWVAVNGAYTVPVERLREMRAAAITQAQALWLETLDTPDSDISVTPADSD